MDFLFLVDSVLSKLSVEQQMACIQKELITLAFLFIFLVYDTTSGFGT